jgi:mRNA interferase MazF
LPSRGDVVLVPFPFTDLTGAKLRPALVLAPSGGSDVVLAFISSQVNSRIRPTEHALLTPDPEFAQSGLKADSVFRMDRLVTLQQSLLQRRIGRCGVRTALATDTALRRALGL